MKRHSATYTVLFALLVCVVCGAAVATTVVVFQDRQLEYTSIERMRHVLLAAGLIEPDEEVDAAEIRRRSGSLRALAVDLETGEVDSSIDADNFDQRDATTDPTVSRPAPENTAGVHRLPSHAVVYEVLNEDRQPDRVVLPIQGLGHNGPIYGYIALDAEDLNTVRGIGFYEHQETRGVAELDNREWQAGWDGRRIYDEGGRVVMQLVRGAGPAETDPHRMDAFTGATVTSIAVRNMLQFWFGPLNFRPFIERYRQGTAR